MTDNIAEQLPFRPRLPEVYGCKDYRVQRDLFVRINEILELVGADRRFIRLSLAQYDFSEQSEDSRGRLEGKWMPPCCPYSGGGAIKDSWLQHTRCALRVNIARYLTGSSLRGMSVQLADSALVRWFCGVNEFGLVKAPSKSTVDRYEDWVDASAIEPLIKEIIQEAAAVNIPNEPNPFGLREPIDLDEAWLDGTCLKANIHYPTDWVLLRDVSRTLMKATLLIRKRGLKNRMPQSPEEFLRDMNKLVIKMTQCRRQKGGAKIRKAVLREMKKLEDRIVRHAKAHREILLERWEETDLSEAQAMQIIRRIDRVLEKAPAAIKQAHERIIGERRVPSKDKILSLYEPDINVIVRGKADAEVEFGNVLRLVEQRQGLIIDWQLHRDPVADNSAEPFAECVGRLVETTEGKLEKLWTDRGMDSAKNVAKLEAEGIANGICPKSLAAFRKKMAEEGYAEGQRRRASTEGRIGLFKNNFLGNPMRNKGFESRRRAVAWGVLAHNLWVIGRLPQAEKEAAGEDPVREAA